MKKRNIWIEQTDKLQVHEDERGKIADLFYKNPIEHIAILTTKSGAVRGNHYHKNTIQHIFLIKGALEYWYKPTNSNEEAKMIKLVPGDIATSSPSEIHTIRALEDSEFFALAEGIRGGEDYEEDTFRVDSIIPEDK